MQLGKRETAFVKKLCKRSKRRLTLVFFLLLPLAFLCVASVAATAPSTRQHATEMPENVRDLLDRCAIYLNGIKTLEAVILERNSRGGSASGKLYIYRPPPEAGKAFGRLRLVYDSPRDVEIIADGKSLFHYDKQEDDLSSMALESSAVSFLLRPIISFTRDVTVRDVEKKGGIIRINLYQTEEPDAGFFTLIFTDTPLELKQWMITDAQGVKTLVTLDQVKFNIPLHTSVFRFQRVRE